MKKSTVTKLVLAVSLILNIIFLVNTLYIKTKGEDQGGVSFDVQDALKIMTQYSGLPFILGGKTPYIGFDSSGLMEYTFSQLGINMSGNAETQYNKTYPISANEARPGDLVFWSTYRETPSHVGMYVGNDEFFNSNSKGVGYSSVSSWSKKYPFLGYRRIAKSSIPLTLKQNEIKNRM